MVTGPVVAGALAGAEGDETTGHPFSSERLPAQPWCLRKRQLLSSWAALAGLHDLSECQRPERSEASSIVSNQVESCRHATPAHCIVKSQKRSARLRSADFACSVAPHFISAERKRSLPILVGIRLVACGVRTHVMWRPARPGNRVRVLSSRRRIRYTGRSTTLRGDQA